MRQRLLLLGLVLFIALDVFLASLALKHTAGSARSDDSSQASSPDQQPSDSASRTPSPADGQSPGSSPSAAAGPVRFLSVSDDGAVLRASRGDCDTGDAATVEFSPDGDTEQAPQDIEGLNEVLGVEAVSGQDLTVIGLDDACRIGRYTSDDGGESWSRKGGDGPNWHLAADPEASSVTAPDGPRSTPCVPLALSTLDQSVVRVLCEEGQILGTDDGGDAWVALGRLPDAVDIRFLSTGDGYGLAKEADCPAAVMRTTDGGTSWERLVCLPGIKPRAVAAQGDLVAAQVGGRTYVSTDGGETWPGADE